MKSLFRNKVNFKYILTTSLNQKLSNSKTKLMISFNNLIQNKKEIYYSGILEMIRKYQRDFFEERSLEEKED